MNSILEEFVRKLNYYGNRLVELPEGSETADGTNLAIFCIRDGIKSRIDFLNDMYNNPSAPYPLEQTNAEYAMVCLEQAESLFRVLKETANEQKPTEFGRSNRRQILHFLNSLQSIIDWLKRTSIEGKYLTNQ